LYRAQPFLTACTAPFARAKRVNGSITSAPYVILL
jgi:hypothetical protein